MNQKQAPTFRIPGFEQIQDAEYNWKGNNAPGFDHKLCEMQTAPQLFPHYSINFWH